jgi:hypothetical protein
MCCVATVYTVINSIAHDVAYRVALASSPVITPVTDVLTDYWVSDAIKRKSLTSSRCAARQSHVDISRICYWCLEATLCGLSYLLNKDGLVVQLII